MGKTFAVTLVVAAALAASCAQAPTWVHLASSDRRGAFRAALEVLTLHFGAVPERDLEAGRLASAPRYAPPPSRERARGFVRIVSLPEGSSAAEIVVLREVFRAGSSRWTLAGRDRDLESRIAASLAARTAASAPEP